MSDLRELSELARDVRERVVVPPYDDQVSRRVRTRRLRGAAGSVAVAVLVVGSFAVWQSMAPAEGPGLGPADHTPEPTVLPMTDEKLWREVVDGTDSHPFETEGTDDGAIAVVWRALEHPEPTFALVIREADGTVHGRRLDEPVMLTPVPGGWVGTYSSRAWLIESNGRWTELGEPAAPRASRAGDVLVRGSYATWLYSPADRSLAASGVEGASDGYVTPDGVLVTCSPGQDGVTITVGDEPGPSVPGHSCVLAGHGDAVTMVGLGDDPDGGIPMTGLLIRSGGSWVMPRMTTMLGGVSSMVITPAGTTAITDASTGDWYLIAADGHFRPVDRTAGEAFVSGDSLYVTQYGFMNAPISWSEDDGRTWHETELPGNEE